MEDLGRRAFLGMVGALGATAAVATPAWALSSGRGPTLTEDPFTLGVASGDPTSTAVMLWTRLATDPINGGGMVPQFYPVDWVVSSNPSMTAVVASGTANALAPLGHSVHVDVTGLSPNSWYWYTFSVDGFTTPVARTRTMPAWGTTPSQFRIGQVCCQRFTEGEYVVYDDMEAYNLDLIVHLGDYIYETNFDGQVRPKVMEEPLDLVGYRNLYGWYKSDPRLQAAHARCPWVFTWDDHEVENNYHNDTPQPVQNNGLNQAQFLIRRAAAYQAWWENMPVRAGPLSGPDLPVYNTVRIGDLATLYLLDTRQYRTPNPCDHQLHFGPRCDASYAPETTMLGADQEAWLAQALGDSPSTWDIVAAVNVFHQWKLGSGQFGEEQWLHDSWDGYPVARQRLLDDLVEHSDNVVVFSGDVHSGWAAHVLDSFDEPGANVIGTEFVVPASTCKPQLSQFQDAILSFNPHIKWGARDDIGWNFHLLGPEWWGTVFRTTAYPATNASSFENGSVWLNVPGLGGAVQWA